MTQQVAQKMVEEAEKLFQDKKQEKTKEKIKEIVHEYLKRIDNLDTKIDELQDEKKQLKLTLEDLKTGKLDILKERLEKDEKARKINTIEIKEVHIYHERYNPFIPYVINYPVTPLTVPYIPNSIPYCGGGQSGTTMCTGGTTSLAIGGNVMEASFTVNGSDCKAFSPGTYSVGSNTVNFR